MSPIGVFADARGDAYGSRTDVLSSTLSHYVRQGSVQVFGFILYHRTPTSAKVELLFYDRHHFF